MFALEELAASISNRYRVTCRFICETPPAQLDIEVELHLYYIAQEALFNAVNHGKATCVVLTLAPDGERFKLTAQDNGSGFDLSGKTAAAWASASCATGPRSSERPWRSRAASTRARKSVVFSARLPARIHREEQQMTQAPKNDVAAHDAAPSPSEGQGGKSRIYIVDDHTMFREGLRQLIEREPNLTVCGDAAGAAEALQGIRSTKPDVVLVDISLAGVSGLI